MNRFLRNTALLLALGTFSSSAQATRFLNFERPGSQVDTIYDDDIFILGSKIKFDSKVDGDLFSFSFEIVQTDSIKGDLNVFAYSAQSLGPIAGSFRAFARTVSANADIQRNLLLFGQDVNVGPQTHIGKNADILGASVIFQGDIAGDLKIRAHMAVISGNIAGNLSFRGDSLAINPNTVIHGDLNYESPSRVAIAEGATIMGQTNWKKAEVSEKQEKKGGRGFWGILVWLVSVRGYLLWSIILSLVIFGFSLIPFPSWIAVPALWLILAVSGNIAILLSRRKAAATERILANRVFPSMGLGFIFFLVTPIAILGLILTIVAAPLALILTMLFGIAIFAGGIYASLHLGRRVCGIFGSSSGNTPGYLCFTIGMTILLALSFIPVLGYIIILAALMAGLGSLAQTFWGERGIESGAS
jgi:hypothetical protein